MANIFNRGDTAYLLLNYTINDEPLTQQAVDELELQINVQGDYRSIKKLLSTGGIYWDDSFTYEDSEGQTQTFSGFIVALDQEDTFAMSRGKSEIQLRAMVGGEVGSSEIETIELGNALSNRVLS